MLTLASRASRQVNRIAHRTSPARKHLAIDRLVLSIYAQCHLLRLQEDEIWVFYEDDSTLNIRPMAGRAHSPVKSRCSPPSSQQGDTHILGTPGDDQTYRQLREMCHRLLNPDCDHPSPSETEETPTQ